MLSVSSLQELATHGVRRVAIACGVFDGLHRGHHKILDALNEVAVATNATPVVLTFDPHPQNILTPDRPARLLLSTAHKQLLLAQRNVDATVLLPFTRELAETAAEIFIESVLCNSDVELTAICVGTKWRFGQGGRGSTDLLDELCGVRNIRVIAVPEVQDSGTISSTRIRQAVTEGDLDAAAEMLGRSFSVFGVVRSGKGIATKLNYPTANVDAGNDVFPPDGIYAASARIYSDDHTFVEHPGILYQGASPTFGDTSLPRPKVEMHIFDFAENIYNQRLEIVYRQHIRADRKFDNVDALCDQIADDIDIARRVIVSNI